MLRSSVLVIAILAAGCGHNNGGTNDGGGTGTDGSGAMVPDGGMCPGAGQQSCNNLCTDTEVDPANCGACGNKCGATQVCLSSGCADSCTAPLSPCNQTCVDESSDNNNCGACNHACGMGTGCVGGQCVPEVPVGMDPAKCANGGPPITVDPGNGMQTCTGTIVSTTFTYGLCTCTNVGNPVIDSAFSIDAYDSTKGPYVPGGLGGSCGANGSIQMSATFDVTGDIRTSGAGGLSIGGQTTAKQSLHVAHRLDVLDVLTVGLDAIAASVAGDAPGTITGNLTTTDCGSVPQNVTVGGACTSATVQVPDPCDCAANDLLPVDAIVTFFSDPAHNDNALINLDPTVYASPAAAARLELPCGYYFLTAINGASERVIGVHGRTAIFVGASISASAPITFTLTPGSTLDVFVKGGLSTSDALNSGTPAYPSHSRFWLSGNVSTAAVGNLNGLFYNPKGTFTATDALTMYGSIFTNTYDGQSSTNIHFDQAAASAGEECPGGTATTCKTSGQTCTMDSDCCQPLYCLSDHTCGYLIQ
jgi:hypothetical protein